MSLLATLRRGPSTLVMVLAASGIACESKKKTTPDVEPTAASSTPSTEESEQAGPQPRHDDAALARVVTKELALDHALDEATLKVGVVDGIVTLTGGVDSLLAKERATRLAEAVRGVRAVSNRLDVEGPEVDDAELGQRVTAALEVDPVAEAYEVEVEVEDGAVTLTGRVDSWPEYRLAERVASSVAGVEEVHNRVVVQYPTSRRDEEILEDVRGRLRWDVLVDHALVDVMVKDGVVQLLGKVGSAAEKRRAIQDAQVNGVERVKAAQLTVEPWLQDHDTRASKYAEVSDEAIRDAIVDAAAIDPRLMSYDLAPQVDAGVVTLHGRVPSLEAKRVALNLARHTVGVVHVNDELDIAAVQPFADEKVEVDVERALQLNPYTEPRQINVEVKNGLARLKGLVDSPLDKAQAESVASRVGGVTEVDNQLTVAEPGAVYLFEPWSDGYSPLIDDWVDYGSPKRAGGEVPSDDTLKQAVVEQLFWEPQASHWQVEVKVKDGTVTLQGTVDSWLEQQSAIGAAYQAGARQVKNELKIEPG